MLLVSIRNIVKDNMEIKFLGTSSVESIPREGCDCPQCSSDQKKNRRLRSCILINQKVLIDAGPDILKQLKPVQIGKIDSVLITHEHDDHTGGLKHLLKIRPDLRIIRLKPGLHFKLLGIDFFAFKVDHSKMAPTVGVIINDIVYIPDTLSMVGTAKCLKEVKFAILDGSALGRTFGGHLSINEIITTVKPFKNLKKIYFTHNGHTRKTHKEMVKLVQRLGDKRFTLAYDGLEIKV